MRRPGQHAHNVPDDVAAALQPGIRGAHLLDAGRITQDKPVPVDRLHGTGGAAAGRHAAVLFLVCRLGEHVPALYPDSAAQQVADRDVDLVSRLDPDDDPRASRRAAHAHIQAVLRVDMKSRQLAFDALRGLREQIPARTTRHERRGVRPSHLELLPGGQRPDQRRLDQARRQPEVLPRIEYLLPAYVRCVGGERDAGDLAGDTHDDVRLR